MIRNLLNGRRYVGSTSDVAKRSSLAFQMLKRNAHHSSLLQRDYNANGVKAFKVELLIRCGPKGRLLVEHDVIERMRPEYNVALTERKRRSSTKHIPWRVRGGEA